MPIQQAVWTGVFTVFGVDVRCSTLEDGTRVMDAGDVEKMLTAINDDSTHLDVEGFQAFARWQKGLD